MKTTLDLPDDLLIQAKQVAAQRRTTLKEIVTQSLRREINLETTPASLPSDSPFEIGLLGLPVLKKTGRTVTSETVRQSMEEADEEDFQTAMRTARGL